MWGRTTGLAILLPAAFFWARGWLAPGLRKRVGAYAVLVVLQVRTCRGSEGEEEGVSGPGKERVFGRMSV